MEANTLEDMSIEQVCGYLDEHGIHASVLQSFKGCFLF